MADDKDKRDPEDNLDTPGDSGLGNLPPLSDFDSGGMDSDSSLPPLGNFDSGGVPSDSAGLPPISDIQVETPQPTGGNVRPKPPGFDSAVTDTFSSGTPGIDTPAGHTPSEGMSPVGSGFQDLAADSDFSPETPEIGPGPDSNVDTPMFDSAFGGGSGSGFGSGTGAPTQAMETPMFGRGGDPQGFDAGAFGGGTPSFGGGTPAPDFSPDTDMRAPIGGGMRPASEPAGGGGSGGGSPMALLVAALIALIIGIAAGPYVAGFLTFLPNPLKNDLQAANSQATTLSARVTKLESDLAQATKVGGEDGVVISPEEVERLRTEVLDTAERLNTAKEELAVAESTLGTSQEELAALNDEYVTRSEEFETLNNELSITQARQRGLVAEVDRLTSQVGQLEEADARRVATKDSLAHAVDRLFVQVKEGLPLTPEKYDRSARIAEVETLQDQIAGSKWVSPALQDAYTNLYLKELAIAQSQEYFYSKIPVIDSYGTRVTKWAECVMNGNHGVDYRTFDGKNIGRFTNQGTGEDPAWGFTEDFSPAAKKEIENTVIANRVEGFEEKIQALVERQLVLDSDPGYQKVFSSL